MRKELVDVLTARKFELESWIRKNRWRNVPEGHLRVSVDRGQERYYYRQEGDLLGKYISAEQRDFAAKLAQRDYEARTNKLVEEELQCINRCLQKLKHLEAPEDVFEKLSKGRRSLVKPIALTDELYVKQFLEKTFEPMGFEAGDPEHYTGRGERVRSKSEALIADYLAREGIPYRYEDQVYLDGYGPVRPDFTALNVRLRKEYFWEHLGMIDKPEYLAKNLRKLNAYVLNKIVPGDRLIITYETEQQPLNLKMISLMGETFLK